MRFATVGPDEKQDEHRFSDQASSQEPLCAFFPAAHVKPWLSQTGAGAAIDMTIDQSTCAAAGRDPECLGVAWVLRGSRVQELIERFQCRTENVKPLISG